MIRRTARILLHVLTGLLLFITAYFIVAGLCLFIPRNAGFTQAPGGIPVYVLSNGVHTDIVVPVRNSTCDWTRFVSPRDVRSGDTAYAAVAFGWGNKGFYLQTPRWADLKVSTALRAVTGLGGTAMHVSWQKNFPRENASCRLIRISPQQYAVLCERIRAAFAPGEKQAAQKIANGYGAGDVFYEARGHYTAFYTCNTWTGVTLAAAGIRTAVWTPFMKSVFYQLP